MVALYRYDTSETKKDVALWFFSFIPFVFIDVFAVFQGEVM